MPEIKLSLVIEHSDHFGSGTLYSKTLETPFCPRQGDRLVLFSYPGEPVYEGPMGIVHEVYWCADGSVWIDIEHFVVDPNEQMENQIRASFRMSSPLHGWYSDRDGDLNNLLLTHGWTTR